MTQRRLKFTYRLLAWGALPLAVLVFHYLAYHTKLFTTYEEQTVGCQTGLLKYEKTWLNTTLERQIIETAFTKAVEQYLGPQPAETDWCFLWDHEHSLLGDGCSDSFSGLPMQQERVVDLLSSNLTDEARRKILREFQLVSHNGDYECLAGRYINTIESTTNSLGHAAEASDIPTFASVRAEWAEERARPRIEAMQKQKEEAHRQPAKAAAK